MFGKQITALQLRKKALLMESDLNRLRLRAEMNQFHEATNLTGHLRNIAQRLGPWKLALAPLAGVALALGLRRTRLAGGFWGKTLAVAPALVRLWRAYATRSKKSE